MIELVTGSNIVTVSVQEKVTIANPQFVFVFVNDVTGKKVACVGGTETNLSHGRSQFTITVGAALPLSGQVLLDDYRFYHYYVYQSANASLFDFTNIDTTDLRTLTGLCEQGKMYWTPPTVTNNYYKEIRTSIKTYGQ
jgi:hypothetical protein